MKQTSMHHKFFITLSIIALTSFSFFLLHVGQRPLCIDSKYVEKIDRISRLQDSTEFRCAIRREIPFDSFFFNNNEQIAKSINSIAPILDKIIPFRKRFLVTIVEGKNYQVLQSNKIYIGENVIFEPHVFTKLVIKSWLRDNFMAQNSGHEVIENALVDFFLFLRQGKMTTYFVNRFNNPKKPSEIITTAMIKSYLDLSIYQRAVFLRGIPVFLTALGQVDLFENIENNETFKIALAFTYSFSRVRDENLYPTFNEFNKIIDEKFSFLREQQNSSLRF